MSKRGRRALPSQELHFGGEVSSMGGILDSQNKEGRAAFENAMALARRKKAQESAMNTFTSQMQKRAEEFNKTRMATMPAEGKLYSSFEEAMRMARSQRNT